MNRINFNHLYYFYIVSKEGSIKSTSEKLHVSQPTISDQIKLLEEYFAAHDSSVEPAQITDKPEK